MSYLQCVKIETAIRRAKKKLLKEVDKKGLYEDFGQKQVGEIKNKFIDICDYSEDMNNRRDHINNFSNWCMNYQG